jgi:hypothetical protein
MRGLLAVHEHAAHRPWHVHSCWDPAPEYATGMERKDVILVLAYMLRFHFCPASVLVRPRQTPKRTAASRPPSLTAGHLFPFSSQLPPLLPTSNATAWRLCWCVLCAGQEGCSQAGRAAGTSHAKPAFLACQAGASSAPLPSTASTLFHTTLCLTSHLLGLYFLPAEQAAMHKVGQST